MTKLNMFRRHNKLPLTCKQPPARRLAVSSQVWPAHSQPTRGTRLPPRTGRLLCRVALGLSLALALNSVMAAGLTQEQRQLARNVSQTAPWPAPVSAPMRHPLGMQTLFIEKQERKNQTTPRWVNVFQYDYDRRQARLLVVDLAAQRVEQQRQLDSVHLPLNETEIAFARQLIEQSDELMQALREDHQRRITPAFERIQELDVKASIFEPTDSEHACASERCALVSLFDRSRTVFSIEPVVHLQSQIVERLTTP